MAAALVDRMAIFVAVRRFHGMDAPDSRSLRSEFYVRMRHFVRRSNYVEGGGCSRTVTRLHTVIGRIGYRPRDLERIRRTLCRRTEKA
jgi:hypothetical protein